MCEVISGLDVPGSATVDAGVISKGEAGICAEAPTEGHTQFLFPDGELQDLKSFFGRKTLLTRGSLSATPGRLYSLDISYSTLAANIPTWVERLRGVRGIKADLVFTVEHNANPFHQGVLVSAFQYGFNQWNRLLPSTCTNLPHVRLDVSHNTMCELRVPYLSEFEYWGSSTSELTHVMGTYGLVQVLPTPALPNSNLPVYKVYVRLENIQLYGRVPLLDAAFIVPQAGVPKLTGKANAEAELEANGQFSGVLATAARLPTAVGRWWPSLRPFTAPVTWFLNASAKAASAFGFSKPVATAPLVRQHRFPNLCEHVVDVAAPATVVGGFQTNSVAVSEALGGTDLDEMAFDTILTRYSQVFRGSLSTAETHGTALYCSHVCLAHMWFRASTTLPGGNISLPRGSTTATAVIPTQLMYFGQHFRSWHGSLTYRVTFAKSKFHTGRVLFTFIPNYRAIPNTQRYVDSSSEGGPAPPIFSLDLQPSQYSMIFDLKDESTFEFSVPYIAPVSHLSFNDSMGFVSMQVLDPLVNNGESASSITYIVEVAAQPGFYFAGLAAPGQPAFVDQFEPVIEFQSGAGATSTDASQHSVGEKFCSAKQLAMVPCMRRYIQTNASIQTGIIPPWVCSVGWGTGSVLPIDTVRSMPFSRSGMVAQCYAYAVGSTLLTVDWPGGVATFRVAQDRRDNGTALTGTVPSLYTMSRTDPSFVHANLHRLTGMAQFLLPTLSNSPRFRVGDFNTGAGIRDWEPGTATYSTLSVNAKVLYQFASRNNTGVSQDWYWGVSAADDARAAAYLGPPPLVLANSGSIGSSWYTANPL